MIGRFYKHIRLYSLDIVTGACICALFVARFLDVELPWPAVAALGIAAWLIYTIDHLIDAKKIKHPATIERHRIHQERFHEITTLSIVVAILGFALLFFVPAKIIYSGITLFFFLPFYFVILHLMGSKPSHYKEIIIALVYSLGIFLGPFSMNDWVIDMEAAVIFFQFAIIAFINLYTFSLYEYGLDSKDGHPSMVILLGVKRSRDLVKILFSVLILSIVGLMIYNPLVWRVMVIYLLMLIVLGLVFLKRPWFEKNELYRVLGDAVFYIPVLYLAG